MSKTIDAWYFSDTEKRLRAALLDIRAELGAAVARSAPSDDQIVMRHVRAAYAIAREAVRAGR